MKVQVNIRMEEELKKDLEQEAKEDDRSLNYLINKILKDHRNKHLGEKIAKTMDCKRFNPKTDVGLMLLRKEKEDGR